MALVPLSYNARSLLRRRASTFLTVASIGATVAVIAGVLALQQGFATLFADNGREDLAVLLRPGAVSEGQSGMGRDRVDILIKSTPEFAVDGSGQPLASAESYLAVRLPRISGGETNVPIRGVQPMTFSIREKELKFIEGQRFTPGHDEVVVGRGLPGRIRGCRVGDVITFNTTPFRVVGVFTCPGPFESEIWGDADRMIAALNRPYFSRIIGLLRPSPLGAGAAIAALATRLAEKEAQTPAKVLSEREYLSGQTAALSFILLGLGTVLGLVMGTAAVFTGTNTMLAAVASRTQEIGILLALGFRPLPIFLAFLQEALFLGLLGGVLGCLMVVPLHGVSTGTTNFDTFTEVAFAFRVTPRVLVTAVVFSLALGVLGGAWPAWRAAWLRPTQALRRE